MENHDFTPDELQIIDRVAKKKQCNLRLFYKAIRYLLQSKFLK
jgi:hypothetical protein